MINETTKRYVTKKIKKINHNSTVNFEDLNRESGVRIALQFGYIWQLINLMSQSLAIAGNTPSLQTNQIYYKNYDGIDFLISLIVQEFYDNEEEYFSLNIMHEALHAYEVHMDKVTLSLRINKFIERRYIELVPFSSLSENNKKLISDNNRIKNVYHLHPEQLHNFTIAYEKSKKEDGQLTASQAAPLGDFIKCMQFALLELPDNIKIEISDTLINSIKT